MKKQRYFKLGLALMGATLLAMPYSTSAEPPSFDNDVNVTNDLLDVNVTNDSLNVNVTNPLGPQVTSNLVTVRTADGSVCPGGFPGGREINDVSLPDGTIDFDAFTVPADHVFVITDVQFSLILFGHSGENIQVRLGVPCGDGCMVGLVDAQVLLASNQGGTHVSLRHGLRVNPGVTLCVADVNQSSPNTLATLHGYFAPNQ